MVIGSKLHAVAWPVFVVDYSALYVRLEYLSRAVSALVVVDEELVYAVRQVPFYPLLEVRSFVLSYGAYRQTELRLGVVSLYLALQPDGVEESVSEYASPAVARHLVRNYSCYYLC